MKKRLISFALAALMIISVCGITVFADGDEYGSDYEWGKLNVVSAVFDVDSKTATVTFDAAVSAAVASKISLKTEKAGEGIVATSASTDGNTLTAVFASVPGPAAIGIMLESGAVTASVEASDIWVATRDWETVASDTADAELTLTAGNVTIVAAEYEVRNNKVRLTFSEPVTITNVGQIFLCTRPNPTGEVKNGDVIVGSDQASVRTGGLAYVDGFVGADGRTYAYTVSLTFWAFSNERPLSYKYEAGELITAEPEDLGIRIVEYIDSGDYNNGTITKWTLKSVYDTALVANTKNTSVDVCWIPTATWADAVTAVGMYQAPSAGMTYPIMDVVLPDDPVLLSAEITDAATGEVTFTFDLPVKLIDDGLDGICVSNGVDDIYADADGEYVTGYSSYSATQVISFGVDLTGYTSFSIDGGYFITAENGWNAAIVDEPFPSDVIYGDADGDGDITAGDAALVLQKVASYDVLIDLVAADANGNGEIDAGDAAAILQYVAGYSVTLGPVA